MEVNRRSFVGASRLRYALSGECDGQEAQDSIRSAATSSTAHVSFLRNLQRLLDEGDFTSTCKFALLNALADLSVEGEPAADGSMRLRVGAVAEKFIEYYWRQARPYRAVDAGGAVLKQNTGKQAAILNTLVAEREPPLYT